ncbi:hypothetical protein [Chitinophaga barathri]|uniref:HTH cro/C1-type domain-containing protein n=1 Tax=Chitinophaga barathri TaxID=1647451 RepID=A0A3N4MV10_9BACT|nr:hypothetical protein [Chitinophaga barathri]RPD39303.1 hypothetical protein EG028_19445 [Chitinophaga barathri]
MKDKRYQTVFKLIEGGHIKRLADIFDTIPRSVLANDMHKNKDGLDSKMADQTKFSLKELSMIAQLIGVPPETIVNIVMQDLTRSKKWPTSNTPVK